MAEEEPISEAEQRPYTPASPIKRIMAWTGVVYMVLLILLNFYALSHGDYLRGVGPLLICPGAAGMASIALYLFKRAGRSRKFEFGLLAAVCAIVFFLGLRDGCSALIVQLRAAA